MATGGEATGGAGTGGTSGVFPPGTTPRILIVGDSVSAGPGCYKHYLAQRLQTSSHPFEFVGEYGDDCSNADPPVRHGAVSCTTSEHYTQPTFTMSNCFVGESFPAWPNWWRTMTPTWS